MDFKSQALRIEGDNTSTFEIKNSPSIALSSRLAMGTSRSLLLAAFIHCTLRFLRPCTHYGPYVVTFLSDTYI